MRKVPVDRELLERVLQHDFAEDCQECAIGKSEAWSELREAIAQPEEAEGVAVVAWANEALSAFISADCKAYGDSRGGAAGSAAGAHQTPLVRQDDHLAALSAVTAERDRLDAECGRLLEGKIQDAETIYILKAERDQLRAEVEALRNDAERYRWLREQEAKDGIAVLPVGRWNMPALLCTTPFDSPEMVDSAVDAAMSAKEA